MPTPFDIIATAARLGCRPWRGPTDGEAFQAWADRVEWADHRADQAAMVMRSAENWQTIAAGAIAEADRQAGYGPSHADQVEGQQP
jgi:hypothetical protein